MLYGLPGVLTKMQTKSIPYTFKRGGYYYFSRRVPSDLIGHYSDPRVVQGLRTRSKVSEEIIDWQYRKTKSDTDEIKPMSLTNEKANSHTIGCSLC